MNNNKALINSLLANPTVLWADLEELVVEPRDLSLNAIETLCRHFGTVEPRLDGNYTLSSRFDKSGQCKIKIGHKGEARFTVITILNTTTPKCFKEILLKPWQLLHGLENARGDMTVKEAWETTLGNGALRKQSHIYGQPHHDE